MLVATIFGMLGGCGGTGSGAGSTTGGGSGGGGAVMAFSGTIGSCDTPGGIANCDEATYTAMGSTDPGPGILSVDQAACAPGSTFTAGKLCSRANAVGFCTTTDTKTLPDGTTYTKKSVLISYPPGYTAAQAQSNCASPGVFSATAP